MISDSPTPNTKPSPLEKPDPAPMRGRPGTEEQPLPGPKSGQHVVVGSGVGLCDLYRIDSTQHLRDSVQAYRLDFF